MPEYVGDDLSRPPIAQALVCLRLGDGPAVIVGHRLEAAAFGHRQLADYVEPVFQLNWVFLAVDVDFPTLDLIKRPIDRPTILIEGRGGCQRVGFIRHLPTTPVLGILLAQVNAFAGVDFGISALGGLLDGHRGAGIEACLSPLPPSPRA